MKLPTYPMRPLNGGPLDHPANATRYSPPLPDGALLYRIDPWRFEPKLNGWRMLVDGHGLSCFNRHGQPLSIAGEFDSALNDLFERNIPDYAWFDCEGLERRHGIGKGSLVVLDAVDSTRTYLERRAELGGVGLDFDWRTTPFDMKENSVYQVPSFSYAEALAFWKEAPLINELLGCTFYEGVVAKRVTSVYKVQLRSDEEPSMDWFKHRFTSQ